MVRIGTLLALVAVIGVWVVSPGVSSADSHDDSPYYDQISASDSYYTLNVAEGSMTVRVEITIQSAGGELETVFFWAMPTAENVVISIDGIPQKTSFAPGDPATSRLSQVWAALPQRIVGAQRALVGDTVAVVVSVVAALRDIVSALAAAVEHALVDEAIAVVVQPILAGLAQGAFRRA